MNGFRVLTYAASIALLLSNGIVSAQDKLQVVLSTTATGPVAQYGDMHRAGVNLAAEHMNAAGGVLGRKIEIIEFDDGCNPQRASEVANEAVSRNVKFVLGPLCSGAVAPAAKIYNDNNIVMIASTASSDDLSTLGHKFFFRTIGKDGQQGEAAADHIVNEIKPRNLAIIHEDQSYGRGLALRVKQDVEAKGLKPKIFEEFNKGDTNFSGLITRLKQLDIDCIYYGGYHPELILMLKQAQEQNLIARWIGPGGVASPVVKGDWAEGLLVTLPPDFSKVPANVTINEAFRARKQDPSASFIMTSYASMQVLADAINRAGTVDPVKVAEFMRNNSFQTVLGDVRFTPAGDNAAARFDIFVWHKDASKSAIK